MGMRNGVVVMKTDKQSPAFARNVARRTRRAGRAYVMCSPLNGSTDVRFESRLELAVAQLLELDPRVNGYRAQPYTLSFEMELDGVVKRRLYTPDFELEVGGITVVIEVKPQRWVDEHAALFARAQSELLKSGKRFLVVTEQSFTGHVQRNVEVLLGFYTQAGASLQEWAAPLLLKGTDELSGHVSRVAEGDLPSNYVAAAGVLLGILRFDMTNDLFETMDFDVWPTQGDLCGFEVLSYEQ